MFIKNVIKKLFNVFGYGLYRVKNEKNPASQQLKALQRFRVELVFDIGANTGQYASALRSVGYKGRLVSFEPLADAHNHLKKNASIDDFWEVHERCAIGDQDDMIDINISGNSVSSSVLPMLDTHQSAARTSAYVNSESVPMYSLDSVATSYIQTDENYYIKIDAQGFESQVLDGATNILRGATGVQIELSLIPLYKGQQLWRELIDRLESEGFTLWALQRGFTDPRDGRTLQMDAIFFRLREGG